MIYLSCVLVHKNHCLSFQDESKGSTQDSPGKVVSSWPAAFHPPPAATAQEECLHSNPSQDTVYFGSHLVAKSKREKKQTVGEDVSRTLSLDHPKTESDGSFLMPPRDSCFSEEEYCMTLKLCWRRGRGVHRRWRAFRWPLAQKPPGLEVQPVPRQDPWGQTTHSGAPDNHYQSLWWCVLFLFWNHQESCLFVLRLPKQYALSVYHHH
ncbi:PREDICTED: uncharacterized protein LOC105586897 isoform X2 [Cercocebus atys]|uniref:uncharacterized protein LOC105586897 isoform X2 n=1 Tax=Cercocebus atys TaxID=9531 RepID=UPI0005F556FE|nr:PREDICTED: uncharacterized protein LOC105586897 isoform X2 [Cercocebus atys]